MSYSFSVKASTKDAAVIAVRDKLVEVVASQPNHEHDCDQAQAAAEAFIALLADDGNRDVSVSVSGSLSWENSTSAKPNYTGANLNVQAYLSPR